MMRGGGYARGEPGGLAGSGRYGGCGRHGPWSISSPATCCSATRSASARMSPDGTRLAWIAPRDGVLNVWVAPVGAAGVDWDAAAVVTDDTDRGIRSYAWARDGRHLLYLQDTGGDENWRLYDVDLQTMARRDLTPFEGIQAQIIATRKSHRDEILVGINRDNPQLHDVYRLDLTTGELIKLIENPGFAGWLADEDMVVRGALAPLPDGGYDVLVRDDADERLADAAAIPADDAAGQRRAGVHRRRAVAAGHQLGRGEHRAAGADRHRHRRASRCSSRTPRPTWPARCCTRTPGSRRSWIVVKDRAEYHVLDPAVQADLDAVRALHAGDPS